MYNYMSYQCLSSHNIHIAYITKLLGRIGDHIEHYTIYIYISLYVCTPVSTRVSTFPPKAAVPTISADARLSTRAANCLPVATVNHARLLCEGVIKKNTIHVFSIYLESSRTNLQQNSVYVDLFMCLSVFAGHSMTFMMKDTSFTIVCVSYRYSIV